MAPNFSSAASISVESRRFSFSLHFEHSVTIATSEDLDWFPGLAKSTNATQCFLKRLKVSNPCELTSR